MVGEHQDPKWPGGSFIFQFNGNINLYPKESFFTLNQYRLLLQGWEENILQEGYEM